MRKSDRAESESAFQRLPKDMQRQIRSIYKRLRPWGSDERIDDWYDDVLAIKVQLHPGRRATLVRPGLDVEIVGPTELPRPKQPLKVPSLHVELRWNERQEVTSFHLTAEPPGGRLPWLDFPSPGIFFAAWMFEWALQESLQDEDPAPPAPGRPPSLAFYRRIQAEYDELLRDGNDAPTAELARRYKTNRETVKSWRHRAKRYITEERKGER
jgi:hypothetical protein